MAVKKQKKDVKPKRVKDGRKFDEGDSLEFKKGRKVVKGKVVGVRYSESNGVRGNFQYVAQVMDKSEATVDLKEEDVITK